MVQFNIDEKKYKMSPYSDALTLIKMWEDGGIKDAEEKLLKLIKEGSPGGVQPYLQGKRVTDPVTGTSCPVCKKLYLITPKVKPVPGAVHAGWRDVVFSFTDVNRVNPRVGFFHKYEDSYINIQNVVWPEELIERWSGISDIEIALMATPYLLPCYMLYDRSPFQSSDGTVYYRCYKDPEVKISEKWIDGEVYYVWDGLVFKQEDVETIESRPGNEHFRDKRASNVDGGGSGADSSGWEKIYCDQLPGGRWRNKSPFDVMDILNSPDGPMFIHEYGGFIDHPEDLRSCYIFEIDLEKWEQENLPQPPKPPAPASQESQTRIHALEEQVKSLQAENADLKAKSGELELNSDDHKTLSKIIQAATVIKGDWDSAADSSPKKKHGYSSDEIKALLPGLPRAWRRAIKSVLKDAGIKVWTKRGSRPQS